jgi:putative aldouronate transport system substrate-binding protein
MNGIKRRQKIVWIMIMALMLTIFLIACSNNNEGTGTESDNETKTTTDSNTTEPAPAPEPKPEPEPAADVAKEEFEQVTLTFLHNWNGGNVVPENVDDNPVTKVIREKTGVTLHGINVTQNETERVNMMFATQDFPDIYAGPAWAGGGEIESTLKGAQEGQLVDLTPYLKQYPNLAVSVAEDKVPSHMWARYFNPANFDGSSYMLYSGNPSTPEDVKDWLYNQYVRKDIAEAVGIDPQSVHTPDEFYNFLKAIKDGGFEENGQSVMPLGGFHGGWALDIMNKMFFNGASGWVFRDDGTVKFDFMIDERMKAILYIRKLVSEGLIDPEAFVQSRAIADEKAVQGRLAVLSAHYYSIYDTIRPFTDAHPEAQYVPVGPLNDASGDPFKTRLVGQGGTVIGIPHTSKNADAAARVLNFLFSDEGALLANYGIEGVHYDMVDGIPSMKEEWLIKQQEDPDTLRNEGIGIYGGLTGPSRTFSLFGGELGHQYDPKFELIAEYTKIIRPEGIELAEGYDPGIFARTHEKWEQIKPITDGLTDIIKQAYYATSDKEAMNIINSTREQLKKAGIEEVEAALTEAAKEIDFRTYASAN